MESRTQLLALQVASKITLSTRIAFFSLNLGVTAAWPGLCLPS
jgi:hypothetical protein